MIGRKRFPRAGQASAVGRLAVFRSWACKWPNVFLISFGVLLGLQTPNLNSGDAGELITAAHYLAVAHPSGYPLYLLLARAFEFLPFGNIAFRVALMSSMFGAATAALVATVVRRLTGSGLAAWFSVVMILGSPSYVAQSAIAKFYPLNACLILVLFALWVHRLLTDPEETDAAYCISSDRSFHATALLFGLVAANHHTGWLMLPPALLAALLLLRRERIPANRAVRGVLRCAAPLALAFFCGAAVNLFLLLRGSPEYFANVFHVASASEFWDVITRGPYGEEGTSRLAGQVLLNPTVLIYGLSHFAEILRRNFGPFALAMIAAGGWFLIRRDRRVLAFAGVTIVLYGPVLAGLGMPRSDMNEFRYYVVAHQYFVPALAISACFLGFGFHQMMAWLRVHRHPLTVMAAATAVFVLGAFHVCLRLSDSNYRLNFVPYQAPRDQLNLTPIGGVFLAVGDSQRFGGRYLKLVGRYRDDVCHLNAATLQERATGLDACATWGYGSVTPDLFDDQLNRFEALVSEEQLVADVLLPQEFPSLPRTWAVSLSIGTIFVARDSSGAEEGMLSPATAQKLAGKLLEADAVLYPDVCDGVPVDDWFTDRLCDRYRRHEAQVARLRGHGAAQ